MNTTELVQFTARGERPKSTPSRPAVPPFYNELVGPLRSSILLARDFLLNEQRVDGSWLARQACDASLPSQLILLLAYLGRDEAGLIPQAAAAILDSQNHDGGWSLMPSGPVDLSTSVQAYFALKLAGYEPNDDRLSMAREVIRQLGGASQADATTRSFLALLGQVSYDACSPVAPEHILLTSWRSHKGKPKITANQSSVWRAPLAVIWAMRPVRHVGVERGVRELFVDKPVDWMYPSDTATHPATRVDRGRPWKLRRLRRSLSATVWKQCERWGLTPLRRRALDRAEAELLRRARPIQIARLNFFDLVWQRIAFDALGFTADSRGSQVCHNRLLELVRVDEEADIARPQLRISPWSDTSLVYRAIRASGLPENQEATTSAAGWLSHLRRPAIAAANSIELALLVQWLSTSNDELANAGHALPPDIRMSESRFARCEHSTPGKRNEAVLPQLVGELLERQNRDGGWSAGQSAVRRVRQNRRAIKQLRPRSAVSTPDTTGIVLEALAICGRDDLQPVVQRVAQCLRAMQRADGSWDSATGVRYIHGTSAAIRGLIAVNLDPDDEAIAAGVNWLIVHQQSSGGWGETAQTNSDDTQFYVADADPSQTAWALSALVAAGRSYDPPARRAVQFLLDAQDDGGQWRESRPVLRDHELGRWYRNELRAVTEPLLALSQWAIAAAAVHVKEANHANLRLVGPLVDD